MSLAAFFAGYGVSSEDVATRINIDPRLFERVDHGRQPLPRNIVELVAELIGALPSDVERAAARVSPTRTHAAAIPLPAKPELGERIPPLKLARAGGQTPST